MQYIKLNNGFNIPNIGYGTFPQKETLEANIPFAICHNYNLIDTSDNYDNEIFVGRGINETRESDYVVISKFSQPFRSFELKHCFYESKNKLNGHLNIYLLHWPFPFLWKKQWRQMEKLYNEGKCDAIGVCNFDLDYMKELLAFCRVKPAINQFERHPLFQQRELVAFCQANGIQVMSYSPLARMDEDLHRNKVLIELGKKYNKTTSQIILRWNIDTNCIPIPASSSEERILSNIDVFDFSLSENEINMINQLEIGKRIRFNPRTRFSRRYKLNLFLYWLFRLHI